ncbi:hypothetical protein Fmac_007910 [Flemingia macrophylla]|uniref:SRP54-type proteins GTP-binding domain-containing protein n=1 Tax=Flemingia macrophylla TaxID=520843 RepID=A0ABD1MVW4_9FABA
MSQKYLRDNRCRQAICKIVKNYVCTSRSQSREIGLLHVSKSKPRDMAQQKASRNGSDVVLVDTAGRMQVGAALSMVYISGAPVMFVGCGQSYTDLKKLNVKSIVQTLLK